MLDSVPFTTGHSDRYGASPAKQDPGISRALAGQLWSEHGWGLSGSAAAVLVGSILAASCAMRMLGWS